MADVWASAHKKSAKALLRAERQGRIKLKSAVSQALALAVAQLETATTRGAALLAVNRAAIELERALSVAIAEVRTNARDVARERLSDELSVIEAQTNMELPRPPREQKIEDTLAAQSTASSYKAAWLALAVAAVLVWARTKQGSPAREVAKIERVTSYRIDAIATTETASAYSAEHNDGGNWVSDNGPDGAWREVTFRRWDARLDRRVCSRCLSHDGEEVRLDQSFRGDSEPGAIHPRCRCISTLVTLPGTPEIIERDERKRREWVSPKTGRPFREVRG